MRIAALRINLVGQHSSESLTRRLTPTLLPQGGWQLVALKTPLFFSHPTAGASQTKVLDQGFFFPIPTEGRGLTIPYKKFTFMAKPPKGGSSVSKRIRNNWEILDGSVADPLTPLEGLRIGYLGEAYSSSLVPKFFSGLRTKPRAISMALRWKIKRTLKRRREALKDKVGLTMVRKKARFTSYVGSLRFLPKRRQKRGKTKSLAALKAPHTIKIKPIRFSGLKIPLVWSKGLDSPRKVTRGLKLGNQPFQLNPRSLNKVRPPLGAFNPASREAVARLRGLVKHPERILQTRYKPGLSKWWRLLRLQFCLSWGLPWLRQRRFTNYVSQLSSVTGLNFLKMCVSSIGFIVRASFVFAPSDLLGDKAFVNGFCTNNPFFQVYKGDRVALLTPSMPTNHRWKIFTATFKAYPFRGWEVDELTKSVSVWSEPSVVELQNLAFYKPLPFLTFRMYNWKYRH